MSIGRSGLTKSDDHGKSNHHCTSDPPAGHRPRFPCSPTIISATRLSGPSGRVTSPCQLHQPVGSAGCAPTMSRTIECIPSAPITRSPSTELPSSNSTRTPFCATDHPDRARVVPDAIGRKAFQQPLEQDPTWDHPHRRAQPVHDRGQIQSGDRSTGRCHHPHGGQRLTGPVHIDTQLPQNRRAVGPDGHGPATCRALLAAVRRR